MQKIAGLLCLFVAIGISGCASMSKKDCQTANWYEMGVQDGRAGQPESKMNGYIATCGKHDIGIDRNNYLSGRDQGLVSYCQPDNGYQIGLKGRSLPNVCPANLQSAFAESHARGYDEYKVRRDIAAAESSMASLDKDIERTRNAIIVATAELFSLPRDADKSSAQSQLNKLNNTLNNHKNQHRDAVGLYACAGAKWYQAGNLDASAGRSPETFDRHSQSCAVYHPAENNSHYRQGYSKGLMAYCTYESGVAIGSWGESTGNICLGAAGRDLQAGHKVGLEQYNEKIVIASLQLKTKRLSNELPELEVQLAALDAKLLNDQLTSAQKLELTRQRNRVAFDIAKTSETLIAAKDELNCHAANWETVGFEQGESGQVFDNRSKNCRSYGISVDEGLFSKGYKLGLSRYCTQSSGASFGALGMKYQNVCPRSSEREFLKGYRPAYAEYQRTVFRAQLSEDIPLMTRELESVRQQVDALAAQLDRQDITRKEKLSVINQVSDLTKKEQALDTDLVLMNAHYQCLTDNWVALGELHAKDGKVNQVGAMQCERFDVSADSAAYQRGYGRGLAQFCTKAQGISQGLLGQSSSACTRSAHPEYFLGYEQGQLQGVIDKEINKLKAEQRELLLRNSDIETSIEAINNKLLDVNLSVTSKRKLTADKLALQGELIENSSRLETIAARVSALGG